jgi:hypothetical protein
LEAGYNANNILAAAYFGQSKLASDGTFNPIGNFAASTTDGTTASCEKKEAGLTLGYTIGAITPKFSYGRVWGASLIT